MTISEEELNLFRVEQEKFLPQRVIIRRKFFAGGDAVEYEKQTIHEDVPCRLTAGFGMWRVVADKFQGITPFTATLPYSQDVRAGDILVDESSRVFEVRDVQAPNSYQTAKRCLCDLVTDA
jgi:hypothetical protein